MSDSDDYKRATGWFEPLYAEAQVDGSGVPWASMSPAPRLVAWLKDNPLGQGAKALVVGCGLGDDAEYVASQRAVTTAFDVAPSAIDLARQRFPESHVDYHVADLFAPPDVWQQAFDLVVEFITVQALPPELQAEAAGRIAHFVAPGGTLLVSALLRDDHVVPQGPPWPIASTTFDAYTAAGLTEAKREETPLAEGLYRVFIVYENS